LIRPLTKPSSDEERELWVGRFRREANVIAGLQSAHTISLYDFGVSQDGRFYFAMELLDGITLQKLVTTFGPQPAQRVRAILLQICASLEEAHGAGLVHRDLKPSNVMLCKVALAHDFVKVLDFGLAKCAACADGIELSIDGMTGGSPGYIAPEVALGRSDVDGRADIYALGCVAYFLLTGSLVFPAATPTAMALKHLQLQPTPPFERTELPVPVDLDRVIMHCLAKDAAARPATVREVAERLTACDFPGWTPEEAAAWWQRHLPPTSILRSPSGIPVT
jgi:serine/threonine-protein kinase